VQPAPVQTVARPATSLTAGEAHSSTAALGAADLYLAEAAGAGRWVLRVGLDGERTHDLLLDGPPPGP